MYTALSQPNTAQNFKMLNMKMPTKLIAVSYAANVQPQTAYTPISKEGMGLVYFVTQNIHSLTAITV